MIFFFIGVIHIAIDILFAVGIVPGMWWVLCVISQLCFCLHLISYTKRDFCYVCVLFSSSGLILMIQLFAAGGSKILVGLLVMIVTFCFALIALSGGLLLIKVRCG